MQQYCLPAGLNVSDESAKWCSSDLATETYVLILSASDRALVAFPSMRTSYRAPQESHKIATENYKSKMDMKSLNDV